MAMTIPLEIVMLLFRPSHHISPESFSWILRGKILTKVTAVIIIPHKFIYLSLVVPFPDAFDDFAISLGY